MKSTTKIQRQERCQVAEILSTPKRTTDIDYAKKNQEILRKRQKDNRKRKEDETLPQKQPFKIKRFQNVESVVFKDPQDSRQPRRPPKAPEPTGPRVVTYTAEYVPPAESPHSSQKDFSTQEPADPSKQGLTAKSLNPNYGKVPRYLEEFKSKRSEELELKRKTIENADCPEGMRLMPEDERQDTLLMLDKGKEEVFQAINKLPIANNSGTIQRRRKNYEEKLTEIEAAVKMFSRPRVYVAL